MFNKILNTNRLLYRCNPKCKSHTVITTFAATIKIETLLKYVIMLHHLSNMDGEPPWVNISSDLLRHLLCVIFYRTTLYANLFKLENVGTHSMRQRASTLVRTQWPTPIWVRGMFSVVRSVASSFFISLYLFDLHISSTLCLSLLFFSLFISLSPSLPSLTSGQSKRLQVKTSRKNFRVIETSFFHFMWTLFSQRVQLSDLQFSRGHQQRLVLCFRCFVLFVIYFQSQQKQNINIIMKSFIVALGKVFSFQQQTKNCCIHLPKNCLMLHYF